MPFGAFKGLIFASFIVTKLSSFTESRVTIDENSSIVGPNSFRLESFRLSLAFIIYAFSSISVTDKNVVDEKTDAIII